MTYYTIYKTINKINNKFYIGKHQTNNLGDEYVGSGKLLNLAIEKYGIENFRKEILYIFKNEEEMNQKERELVTIGENSYNLCEGGNGGFGYINKNGLGDPGKGGSKNKKEQLGIFDPNKQHLRTKWGKYAGMQTKNLKKGLFDPSNKQKVLEGNKKAGIKNGTKMRDTKLGIFSADKELLKEWSKKSRKSKGKIHITNGIISKQIYPNEEMPNGFHRGRTL